MKDKARVMSEGDPNWDQQFLDHKMSIRADRLLLTYKDNDCVSSRQPLDLAKHNIEGCSM